jgi:hypothetical protein
VGLLLLAAAVLLLVIDPSGKLLMRVAGILGTLLFLFSCLLMLLTFRKARHLSPWSLLLVAMISLSATLLFYVLMGSAQPGWSLAAATATGGLLGLFWSLTNRLERHADGVMARGNSWYLALWAGSLAVTQLSAILSGRAPGVMTLFSFFGMGLAVSNSLGLLVRMRWVQRGGGQTTVAVSTSKGWALILGLILVAGLLGGVYYRYGTKAISPPVSEEEKLFITARQIDTPFAYQLFLRRYPSGRFVQQARLRLEPGGR